MQHNFLYLALSGKKLASLDARKAKLDSSTYKVRKTSPFMVADAVIDSLVDGKKLEYFSREQVRVTIKHTH